MKQRGTISLDDAVAATQLTRTTLREHLGQLERDRLVARSTRRKGRGRPSLRYSLTPTGELLFPSSDGKLLGKLLGFLKGEGREDLLEAFFTQYWERRYQEVAQRLRDAGQSDPDARLAALETLLTEQGFMPQITRGPDAISVRECNCPFPEAVKQTRIPCRLEAEFFERLFNTQASRISYIPDGSPACTYEFPTDARE